VQLTSFIGRQRERAEIRRLLDTVRLLTLTGVGGVGKTRLALQVAAEVLEESPDGSWLVELAPLADPALLPNAIAAALKVRDQSDRPILDVLVDYLEQKRLLIVLDNCEHLITASARVADELLRACPNLKILATSREGSSKRSGSLLNVRWPYSQPSSWIRRTLRQSPPSVGTWMAFRWRSSLRPPG